MKQKRLFAIKRILVIILSMTFITASNSLPVFATETIPEAKLIDNNTVTFSNLDNLAVNESIEFDIVDSEGNPAKVGIQRMPTSTRASGKEWKVWYTAGVINAQFYMTVSNNKVTSVYDDWIMIVGGTFSNESLTRTSTYGKLTFTVNVYAGIASSKCWLKGTVTGKDNAINVSWQM